MSDEGPRLFLPKSVFSKKSTGSNDPTHSQPQHGHTTSGPICTAHMTGHPTWSKLCHPGGRHRICLTETPVGPVLPVSFHRSVHIMSPHTLIRISPPFR